MDMVETVLGPSDSKDLGLVVKVAQNFAIVLAFSLQRILFSESKPYDAI
ncbi:hypothetical protein TcasGA2_TC033111 [Tribolium castaneum]|uniref:Uncharacterized protein n=1 Tax=Tribolium castaneum TaxID=7070 RepID=A0A139WGN4_TRICA|nr:hypothetical protein TcasGA2_TC033111 [Tribolium castaneum]